MASRRCSLLLRRCGDGALLGLILLLGSRVLVGQAGPAAGREAGAAARATAQTASESFTPQEEAQIVAQVLQNPEVRAEIGNHTATALRVVKETVQPKDRTNQAPRVLAHVFFCNDHAGSTHCIVFDQASGQVVSRRTLKGTLTPTEDERDEARSVVSRQGELAPLLAAGCRLSGGFVASAPDGESPSHRYMQFQVLSPDRKQIERVVVFDLSTRAVVPER